jgi:hypothetical protein
VVSHYPEQYPDMIGKGESAALQSVTELLSDPTLWPDPAPGLPEFETMALADYRLAAAMDLLGAHRALLGQAYRAGETVLASEWKGWADAMSDLTDAFEGLWRLRFRPSRLADNLKLMRLAEAECRSLAGSKATRAK